MMVLLWWRHFSTLIGALSSSLSRKRKGRRINSFVRHKAQPWGPCSSWVQMETRSLPFLCPSWVSSSSSMTILVWWCQQAAVSWGTLVLAPGDLGGNGTQLTWPLQCPSLGDGELMSFAVNSAVPFAPIKSGFLQLYGGQPGYCPNFAFPFCIPYAEKQRELARKGSLKNGNMGSPVNQQPKKNNVMARTR